MKRQDELVIGDWWAPCCLHDLEQITTPDELTYAQDMIPFSAGFSTLREAVAYYLHPDQFRFLPSEERALEEAYAREHFPAAFEEPAE